MVTAGPSPHLTWAELACKDGTPYPVEWRANRAVQLALAFEAIRELYAVPIRILSAFRTAEHNRQVGGASKSQHVEGRALDLAVPPTIKIRQFAADVELLARKNPGLGIRGIGIYPGFVHIDVRPALKLTLWHGGRKSADLPEAS